MIFSITPFIAGKISSSTILYDLHYFAMLIDAVWCPLSSVTNSANGWSKKCTQAQLSCQFLPKCLEVFTIFVLLIRMDIFKMVSHLSRLLGVIAKVFKRNKHIGIVLFANDGAKPYLSYSREYGLYLLLALVADIMGIIMRSYVNS